MPFEPPKDTAALAYFAPVTQQPEIEAESPSVPLSHYLWILRRYLWRIVAFVATCVLATAIVSFRLQRVYESTATIEIEQLSPPEIVGQQQTQLDETDPETFLTTQMRLIQSDSVLRPVAEQFHLLHPDGRSGADSQNAQRLSAGPVSLGGLRVTRPSGTDLLLISFRSPDPRLAADVANAVAKSYMAHTYNLRMQSSTDLSDFMEKQLDELRAKMEQSNLALNQFEKDLDVINPDEKTDILSARLLQLNTEYTNAQADRVSKEAAWDTIKSGSLAAEQVSSQGETLAKLSDSLDQARQHFALVKATYGSSHPEYRKAASELAEIEKQYEDARQDITGRVAAQYREALNREQMLEKAVTDTKADWDRLNARSFEFQQLKHEADADKGLYDELIRKIREANINSGFHNNNISIADYARPPAGAVYPNTRMNLLMAFVISLFLAGGTAMLMDSLDTTLRDPAEASRFLGADVIATLPTNREAAQLPRAAEAAAAPTLMPKLSDSGSRKGYYGAGSSFDEAIRTLRNTILLSDFESRLHSIVLTSAVPSEGKTTLTAHLAIANADRGKNTLLVDADLRRPSLHSRFGVAPQEGLANVLNGEMAWQDAVIPIEGKPNLSLLPAGLGSHRAADLIGSRLATLLDEFAKKYDLVILDSPPLLGFAECLQIAAAADGVLITSLAGETRRRAVAEVISALRRVHANIIGVVLNQMSHHTSSDGYSYYGYNHYYYDRYRTPRPPESKSVVPSAD
ncbi:MAG: polysaccharide biosynthesis tyrosine autokinase [Terracidiphilus sp.]